MNAHPASGLEPESASERCFTHPNMLIWCRMVHNHWGEALTRPVLRVLGVGLGLVVGVQLAHVCLSPTSHSRTNKGHHVPCILSECGRGCQLVWQRTAHTRCP